MVGTLSAKTRSDQLARYSPPLLANRFHQRGRDAVGAIDAHVGAEVELPDDLAVGRERGLELKTVPR